MVCFHIVEEAKTKANKYEDARRAWVKLLKNNEPTTGASNTRQCKKISE